MIAEVLDTRRRMVVKAGISSRVTDLDRRYCLMYLAAAKRYLTKSEIDSLGDTLYEDVKRSRVRSLREVAQEAGVLPRDTGRRRLINARSLPALAGAVGDWLLKRDDSFASDAFLNHVVPAYGPEEMEETFEGVFLSGKRTTGMIDLVAGFKHSRPLLFELELMEGLGLVIRRERRYEGRDDIFVPTFAAKEFSKAISLCFEAYNWPRGLAIPLQGSL